MKRIVFQAANQRYRELAALTTPAVQTWCGATGWDYLFDQLDDGVNHNIERHRRVAELLNCYEAVMWLDVDITPCARRDLDLDWKFDGLYSLDYNGLCIGAFVYRNTDWSKWFLDTAVRLFPNPETVYFEVQDAVKKLTSLRVVKEHVGYIPQREIANRSSLESDRPGVFYHHWANQGYEQTLADARTRVDAFFSLP